MSAVGGFRAERAHLFDVLCTLFPLLPILKLLLPVVGLTWPIIRQAITRMCQMGTQMIEKNPASFFKKWDFDVCSPSQPRSLIELWLD